MWLRRTHPRFDRVERALIVGDLKFVASTDGRMKLFDLRRDPHEATDIYSAAGGPGEVDFPARLDEWLASHEPGESSSVTLDERTMQKLKALGYIR